MYENCACFIFHDVTLTQILGVVFDIASSYYHTILFFIPGGHFNGKKTMIFGQFASAAMLLAKFHTGTRKSLSDFGRIHSKI